MNLINQIYPDRLNFQLKNFVRIAWASPLAESAWSSRFACVRKAVTHVEWLSVVHKVRPCALFQLRSQDMETNSILWAKQGLRWRLLADPVPCGGAWWLDANLPRSVKSNMVVIGSESANAQFEQAWRSNDHEVMGALLGYPPCCRLFFEDVCITQRCIDTVWAMSERESGLEDRTFGRLVDGPIASNILLQSLGVRAVPHSPCSFVCRGTARLAEDLRGVAESTGYGEEYRWLLSILSWPAEWSALHGIAEIRTPVIKLCTPTDATAGEYVVRWQGSHLPAEAANGLSFPYKVSGRPTAAVRLEWSRPR